VIGAYLGVQIVAALAFSLAGQRPRLFSSLVVANLLVLAALLALYKLLTATLDAKPLASVGIALHSRWKAELGIGTACGTVMIFAVAGTERLFGLAHFSSGGGPAGQGAMWGLYAFVLFSVAGAAEELTFRGYPFQRLVDSIGPVGATAVFSALFGVAHLGNQSHTLVSTANTMFVGVTFAIAYLRTRSLWLPIGLHFSWNFFQGYVLGFPVSGIMMPHTLLRVETTGADWLSGGAYGPEGGLVAGVVIILGTGYLALTKSIYITQEMKELVSTAPQRPAGSAQAEADPLPETSRGN
jgi:CAAX protease family protein